MWTPTPEELADKLLRADALKKGKTLRELGILTPDRQKTIREWEVPMSILERDDDMND